MDRQQVLRDVKDSFGIVPGFINAIPDPHIEAMWTSMKQLQLQPGQIPPKYQQLMMLAVSTYAKCKYCTDFHTEAARALGASESEIAETALLVGHTAMFSNWLGGTQYDFADFQREVRLACKMLGGNGGRAKPSPSARA